MTAQFPGSTGGSGQSAAVGETLVAAFVSPKASRSLGVP